MSVMVSINCLTYNQEDIISDAIESFLAQKTDFTYEILIGDDCSTDDTRKIVKGYMELYPDKVRLITAEENGGYIKNARRLHVNSSGKYIALCDGDDFWIDPYKLQKQVDYMEQHPECSLCFHAANVINYEKEPLGTFVRSSLDNRTFSAGELALGGGGFLPTSSMLYPKKLLDHPPKWYYSSSVGDYPLALILTHYGYSYYIDEIMSSYRTGVVGSWTSNLLSGKSVNLKKLENNKGDIKILQSFNEFSNYKYKDEVDKAILYREFYIAIYDKNENELKLEKYKPIFNELGIKQKAKYLLLFYLPNFSARLSSLYGRYIKTKYNILN